MKNQRHMKLQRSWGLPTWSLAMLLAWQMLSVAAAEPPATESAAGASTQWAQWRGPLGTGVGPAANPPLNWSDTKNIRWKVKLPGRGHSTPIIWGERIFLTTAIPTREVQTPRYSGRSGAHDNLPVTHRHKFVVVCVDRKKGKVLWEREVDEALPLEGAHHSASLASASVVATENRVVAFFGSRGLYGLDHQGNVLWKKQFGTMETKHGHGEGSSPALHENTVVINWDHEGDSFVAAFDIRDGRELWKVPRSENTSWSSPIIVMQDGKPQAIVSGTNWVRGYDLADGKQIWQCGGLSSNVVATPVAGEGMVFVGSSYEKQAMLAIRLAGARGDLTGTDHVVWTRTQRTPYVPTPLLYDGWLYYLRHYQGILSRVRIADGAEPLQPTRLPQIRNVYASPVGAAGRIYVTDLDGTTLVLSGGDIPRLLTVNRLSDSISASAALVGNELFLRGDRFLYCIAEE